MMSLIDTIRQGGSYWKHERSDSPGHSIAIPNGTAFKIAIEGPGSHRFIRGICRNGRFVVTEGIHAGSSFNSANEAVNAVREPSSNAFLHLHLHIDGEWTIADDLRRHDGTRLDKAEELALEEALRRWVRRRHLDSVEAVRAAAELVASHPEIMEIARGHLALADIDVDALGEIDADPSLLGSDRDA